MSQLNDEEKVKVRHYLGYLNVQAAQTFVLGVPAGVETTFMLEGAMDRLIPAAVGECRRHLQILSQIEAQKVDNLELLQITKIGEIEVNSTGKDKEQTQLDKQFDYWANSLANLLGVIRNPFDKRKSSNGINVRVC